MANMQMVLPGTPDQQVACAIWCCDKKPYPLVKRKGDKECQRLGSKKHSCVLHQLREKSPSGKLTTKSRFKEIKASPRYEGVDRTLIPDIQIGDRIIDAKFPCDPAKVQNTTGKQKIVQRSQPGTGQSMIGKKEKEDYMEIEGVKSVKGMTPQDAETKKHSDCKCESSK